MKTANIGNIAVEIPNTKKERFNLNHDNNTTYDWGSVQPILSKMMMPDSTINVNNEQLIRLAPMVVPTFGRVKIKNIAHFIPISEIFPNWDALLAQTKVTRSAINNGTPSASTYTPKWVPHVPNNILLAWCLAGAKANLYYSGMVGTVHEDYWQCARNLDDWETPEGNGWGVRATRAYGNELLNIQYAEYATTGVIAALQYTGFVWNPNRIITNTEGQRILNTYGENVLKMPTITTMTEQSLPGANYIGYTHSFSNEKNTHELNDNIDRHITFDGSDIIWEYRGSAGNGITSADRATNSGTPIEGVDTSAFDGRKIRIVFKLSSFGKRLRKVLIGLGYDGENLANCDEQSILPLVAYYKAWWDSFAPERTKNFYETNAWKLINATLSGQVGANLVDMFNLENSNNFRDFFVGFMGDLGTCFATEKIDAISAATDAFYNEGANLDTQTGTTMMQERVNEAIGAILQYSEYNGYNPDGSNNNFSYTSAFQNPNTAAGGMTTLSIPMGRTTVLTQPQLTALKLAYITLNKNSIAGQVTAEILRANGQGDYVEECNGKFINDHDEAIKISDVVATAATDKASLGQYGGRGLGLTKMQFSYSTGRWGYLIILSCMIPESGYINSPLHENEAYSFDKIYQAQFDGLSYEAIQKKALGGSPVINDPTYKKTFGFLPTYSQWKFMCNKANGDFSLNSRRTYMTPYTLDKYIPVGNANVQRIEDDWEGHEGTKSEVCTPVFRYEDLANAGEDYRYINKFPWNGNYNRIFEANNDGYEWNVFSINNNAFLFDSFEYDNFMVHNVFEIAYFAHMKSIEKSYGTYDEEHNAPDTTMKRS